MTDQVPIINFNPKRIFITLISILMVLVGLSIWGQRIRYIGVGDIHGPWHEFLIDLLMQSFYLDLEGNIPTYYNVVLLLIPTALLFAIGASKSLLKDKFRYQWYMLAFVFLLLSIDEASSLHERLIKPMREFSDAGRLFYFAWIVPGIAAVILFGLFFLMFFLHLDRKFKVLFFISLAVYIGGVIGGEIVSGYYAANLGLKNFTYAVVASLEESVEMIGASMIIYSLLVYIKDYLPEGITFKV
ncbi:MAG: hypothetical protein H7Y59_00410 [Anaerolineales bacterium]|nr:hypothetical protein [Anaerolineales bacterium]